MSQHRTRAAAARENRLPANDDELDNDEIEIVPGSRAVSSDTSVIGAGNSVPNQETSPSRKSRVGPHEPSGVNVSSTDKPPSRQGTDGRRRRDAPSSQAAADADRAIASEERSSVAARSRGAAAESPSASRTPSGKNSVKGKTSAGASSGAGVDEYAKRYSGGSGGMMSSSFRKASLSEHGSDSEDSSEDSSSDDSGASAHVVKSVADVHAPFRGNRSRSRSVEGSDPSSDEDSDEDDQSKEDELSSGSEELEEEEIGYHTAVTGSDDEEEEDLRETMTAATRPAPKETWEGRKRKRNSADGEYDCTKKTKTWYRGVESREYRRRKWIMPDKFDGTQPWQSFRAKFMNCVRYNRWSNRDAAAHLRNSLTGQAELVLWTGGGQYASFKALMGKLERQHGSRTQGRIYRAELEVRRRRSGETLSSLGMDIARLTKLAYPGMRGKQRDGMAADAYLRALSGDPEVYRKVRELELVSLDMAVRQAERFEAYTKADQREKEKELRRTRNDALPEGSSIGTERINEGRRVHGNDVGERGVICFRCGKEGHIARFCRWNGSVRTNWTSQLCYGCGQRGHIRRQCENTGVGKEEDVRVASTRSSRWRAVNDGGEDGDSWRDRRRIMGAGHKVYVKATLAGREIMCLLDTGCEKSLIRPGTARGFTVKRASQRLYAANGARMRVKGSVDLPIQIGGFTLGINALVVEDASDNTLGMDWLKRHGVSWSMGQDSISIHGRAFKLQARPGYAKCRQLILMQDVTIPSRSQTLLPAEFADTREMDEEGGEGEWATETVEPRPDLLVARILLPARSSALPVQVLNLRDTEVILKKGTPLTMASRVEVEASEERNGVVPQEHLEELIEGVSDEVTEEGKHSLRDLLYEFPDVFSSSDSDLGQTGIAQHYIDTGEARPIRQTLRRQPMAHLPQIDTFTEDMLKTGVIEPSNSPWASNLVLVTKKDGTTRFCVDFRKLNEVSCKDAYPLPRADSCFDAMHGAKWFSTFDLRSGYYQVKMHPDSAEKTSFVTRTGSYQFKVMPFGLCGAGATFQRVMNIALAGLTFQTCLVYLDDIIIYSRSVEEHVERMRGVFQRLRSAGLKLKPSKCMLLRRSVEFLGHIVSDKGVHVNPAKTSAIQEWPQPETVRDVRSFIGLCSYYRKFVKDFATIATPLHRLMEKEVCFEWDDESQEAFEKLKLALTSPPILAMPNECDVFVLDTDASDKCIGAVLSQRQEGEEKVIAYASKALSQCEKNYCVTRREMLALVHFVKEFRPYLLGRRFVIRTDHAALRWLQKTPEPIGQQARWLESLSEYDFEIQHRAGKSHGNADALSRRPCKQCKREDDEEPLETVWRVITVGGNEVGEPEPWWNVPKLTREDKDLAWVMDRLGEEEETGSGVTGGAER